MRGEIRKILLDDLERLGNFFRDHIKDPHRVTAPGEYDRPSAPDQPAPTTVIDLLILCLSFSQLSNGQFAVTVDVARRGVPDGEPNTDGEAPLHCSDDQGQSCYRRLPARTASAATGLT